MSCYCPLPALSFKGQFSKNGKKVLHFLHLSESEKISFMSDSLNKFSDEFERVLVPCGQCIGCRLDYSRQWAMRCMLESLDYENNWFITLTYDDEHIPRRFNGVSDSLTGEFKGFKESFPLKKSDIVKFNKDLREYYRTHFNHTGIRFYGCGEYGDKNGRPHYHILFFNLPISDLKPERSSKKGSSLFSSSLLSSLWNKGLVRIGEVNYQSCAYVARYINKKHKGLDSNFYEDNFIEPEFSLMSRRPGVGSVYFDKHTFDIYGNDYDKILFKVGDSSLFQKPPKYYDSLFESIEPDTLKQLKDKRRDTALSNVKNELMRTSKSYYEYLLTKYSDKTERIKSLMREL